MEKEYRNMEWTALVLIVGAFSAVMVGFSKTGIPSLGILAVTLFALIFPAKYSVGILLPMLIVGDIVAVAYYRKAAVWKYLVILIPSVVIGVISGYFVLDWVDDRQLSVMIGAIVLVLIAVHLIRDRLGDRINEFLSQSRVFTDFLGWLAGFTTMVGNAAGGVMSIYFLSKGLPKKEFVGTGAWYFLLVNLFKVPFNVQLGLITAESLLFNAYTVPFILLGAWIGIRTLPRIPQKHFQMLVLFFSAVGGVWLLLP